MDNIRLSEHFMLEELVRSGTASQLRIKEQFNVPPDVINRLSNLCIHVLDPLKEQYPDLKITSGYRCKRLNNNLGGVHNSQHLIGEAADIYCSDLNGLERSIKSKAYDQLIRYDTFIHVSYNIFTNRYQYLDYREHLT